MTTDGIVGDQNIEQVEAMIPQSKMNEVVGREKRLVEQRVRQEMEARLQQELANAQQQPGIDVQDIISQAKEQAKVEAMAAFEERQKEMQAEMQKEQYLTHVNQVASNYLEKMKSGPSMYEDFDAVTADFDPREFKELVFLAHDLPELPHIIYELSQDSDKLVRLDRLAEKSPKMAQRELAKLAKSIQANQTAKKQDVSAKPPLMSVKPSSGAGVGDTDKLGLKDLKKASWLRG